MKTPASILGILGRFLTVLCLTGTAMAEANPPPAPAPKAAPTPIQPVVAAKQTLGGDSLPTVTTPKLSPWTKEIVKLTQSGIDEPVMLAFIDNSGSFELGADQIVYLNDIGVPGSVVGAMLQHDRELASGERLLTIVSEPPYEPLFPVKSVSGIRAAAEPAKAPVAPPPVVPEPSVVPSPAVPPPVQTVSSDWMEAPESMETTSTFASAPQPRVSETRRTLYPVREPHTVEIMPPIVFLNTAEVAPNTLIVYGFPSP